MTAALLLVGLLVFALGSCSFTSGDQPGESGPTAVSSPSADATPTKAKPKPAVLIAVGDIACDPTSPYFTGMPGFCEQEKVGHLVGRLVDAGADWFVPLGDDQYESGQYSAFKQVYDKAFGAFKKITEPVAGNHEWVTPRAAGYFRYFGARAGTAHKPWRSFSPGPGWRVLLLDSNCEFVGGCGPDSRQGRWIKETLARSKAQCVIAAWHHPLRTSGEYAGIADSYERAAQLWPIVARGGGDIVLNGHDHLYERFRKFDGVKQFTVGTGGKNPNEITTKAPGSQRAISHRYGVLKLTLFDDGRYRYAFVATDGHVLDSGAERCTNAPSRG
ncbi:MAG TPA: metallophosphoesterase [Actinomycetes bacterium]|nr:metallophosphoesterase [Actinomycetes bacterium]